ncbi:unnamed protein product [Blepharisma stoltei]|uniref:Uncharacterized protein n=1 Tax=Blepharisma stoltei TaxID=1481888 RepID=A0AAU9IHN0_9CILI|nr:unnamed protein product [Blepharisma stoltei]
MECFKCSIEFENQVHIPRILTSCGHTLCEFCLKSLFENKAITCPQCNVISSAPTILSFPTNLALMQIQTQKTSQNVCAKHNKDIEAFCYTDKKLLCVSCILEDGHKSHEMTTINKAAAKQREKLEILNASISQIEGNLNDEQDELEKRTSSINTTHDKLIEEFSGLYQAVREAIDSREKEIVQRIKETADSLMNDINERKNLHKEMIRSIKKYKNELNKAEEENDLSFIQNFNQRESLGKNICKKTPPLQKVDLFSQFSREVESDFVCKVIKQTFVFPARAVTKRKSEENVEKYINPTPTPAQSKEIAKPSLSDQQTIRKTPAMAKKEAATRPKSNTIVKKPVKKVTRTINLNKEIPASDMNWLDDISAITSHLNEEDTLSTISLDLTHLRHN